MARIKITNKNKTNSNVVLSKLQSSKKVEEEDIKTVKTGKKTTLKKITKETTEITEVKDRKNKGRPIKREIKSFSKLTKEALAAESKRNAKKTRMAIDDIAEKNKEDSDSEEEVDEAEKEIKNEDEIVNRHKENTDNKMLIDEEVIDNGNKKDKKNKLISSDCYHSLNISKDFYKTFGANDIINNCCVSCTNRNIMRAVNENNTTLLNKCFEAKKEISNINEKWSVESNVSPVYLATIRQNKNLLIEFSKFYNTKKLHFRIDKPSSKLQYITSGRVGERTFGRHVRAVGMTRGGRQGNNAFLNDYYLVNNWKLDFINGLIKNENSSALFPLIKAFGFANPEFVHYSRRMMKKVTVDESKYDNETNLYKAVSAGRKDLAIYIIKNQIGKNCMGYNNLHLEVLEAKSDKDIEVTFRPSVNKKSTLSVTPVHFACINPNPDILRKLVENDNGGDIHFVDLNFKKPIHYASACVGTGPLKYLLEVKNCSPDEPDKTKTTPLMYAAKYGRLDNIKLLLEKGADINKRQGNGQDNCFIVAAKEGNIEIVKYFVEKQNIDVNSYGKDKCTAMHYAAMSGNEKLLGYLVIKNANINIKDKLGRTPLIIATKAGQSKIVELLLKLKAKVDIGDTSKNTALHYACAYGWLEIVDMLIKNEADINCPNSWKSTPLEITLLKNHIGILKYLLEEVNEIDINAKFENGKTLLLNYLENITPKSLEGINYLVKEKKADPNSSDTNKISPLHILAKFNFEKYVNAFYPAAIKPITKESLEEDYKEKKYVIECEDKVRQEHKNCLKTLFDVLISKNADINAKDSKGNSPIIWALNNHNLAMIELLLESKDINLVFSNVFDQTVLSFITNILFINYNGHFDAQAKNKKSNGNNNISNAKQSLSGASVCMKLIEKFNAEYKESLKHNNSSNTNLSSLNLTKNISNKSSKRNNSKKEGNELDLVNLYDYKGYNPILTIFRSFGNLNKVTEAINNDNLNKEILKKNITNINSELNSIVKNDIFVQSQQMLKDFVETELYEIISLMLSIGADPNSSVSEQRNKKDKSTTRSGRKFNKRNNYNDNNDNENKKIKKSILEQQQQKYVFQEGKMSPLMFSMNYFNDKIVKLLVKDYKANINQVDFYNQTALFYFVSISTKNLNTIVASLDKLIVDYKADVNIANYLGITPLMLLCYLIKDNTRISLSNETKIKLKKEDDEDSINNNIFYNPTAVRKSGFGGKGLSKTSAMYGINQISPNNILNNIFNAASNNDSNDCSVYAHTLLHGGPLGEAIKYPFSKELVLENCLDIFYTNKADFNLIDKYHNYHPLFDAVKNNNIPKVELLLFRYKVNPNLKDNYNRNALHYYMQNDNCNKDTDYSILNILLDNKCDINHKDYLSRSPVFYLFVKDDLNISNKTFNKDNNNNNKGYGFGGCRVKSTRGFGSNNGFGFGYNNNNSFNNDNNTSSINNDPIAVLSSLIPIKTINWNITDIYNNNLLHYTNIFKNYICHSSLLNKTNIEVNVKNLEGNTPISYSILYQNNFTSELKSKGGNLYDKVSPLNENFYLVSEYQKDIVYNVKHSDIIENLLKKFSDYDKKNKKNKENDKEEEEDDDDEDEEDDDDDEDDDNSEASDNNFSDNDDDMESEISILEDMTTSNNEKRSFNFSSNRNEFSGQGTLGYHSGEEDNNDEEEIDEEEDNSSFGGFKKPKRIQPAKRFGKTAKKAKNKNNKIIAKTKEFPVINYKNESNTVYSLATFTNMNGFFNNYFICSTNENNLKLEDHQYDFVSKNQSTNSLFTDKTQITKGLSLLRTCMKLGNQGMVYYLINEGFDIFEAVREAFKEDKLNLALMLLNKSNDNSVYLKQDSLNKETLLVTFSSLRPNSFDYNNLKKQVVQTLIKKNINILATDIKENTALHYAMLNLRDDIIDIFKTTPEFINNLSMINNESRTPINMLFNRENLTSNSISKVISILNSVIAYIKLNNTKNSEDFIASILANEFKNSLIKEEKLISNNGNNNINNMTKSKNKNKINKKLGDTEFKIEETIDYEKTNGIIELINSLTMQNFENFKILLDIMIKNGCSLGDTDNNMRNVFHIYAMENNRYGFEYLTKVLMSLNKSETSIILNSQDNLFNSVIHYIVQPNNLGSYENKELLNIALTAKFNLTLKNKDGKTPLMLAANQSSGVMYNILKQHDKSKVNFDPKNDSDDIEMVDSSSKVDYIKLAQEYYDINKSKIEMKMEKKCEKIDNPAHMNPKVFNVLKNDLYSTDETKCQGLEYYSVSMTKVNVSRSYDGGDYMFYVMQIIYDQARDLYILWNRWGRIGEIGAYQRTPFNTKVEAIKEFSKIFKSKTKNDWFKSHMFEQQRGKYNLQRINRNNIKHKELLKPFDNSKIKKLNDEESKIIARLSDISLYNKIYTNNNRTIDSDYIKLSNLDKQVILKARDILDEISTNFSAIEEIRAKKMKIKTKINGNNDDDNIVETTDTIHKHYSNIYELSSRYYELIPKESLNDFDVKPIYGKYYINEEYKLLYNLLNVEKAMQLLLAAQYKSPHDPYSFIINALDAKISVLNNEDFEYKILEKYVSRSSSKIRNIIKVNRSCEIINKKTDKNTILLFHGTRTCNILGILSSGFQVAPFSAVQNGEMHGKGIYFADKFSKAESYSVSGYGYGDPNDKYVFACEVDLGKCHVYKHDDKMNKITSSFNSLHVPGTQKPDPNNKFVFNSGLEVPLGELQSIPIKNCYTSDSEYIVFTPEQVKIRYMIALGNEKIYR